MVTTNKRTRTFNDGLHIIRAITVTRQIPVYHNPILEFPLEEVALIEEDDHDRLRQEFGGTDGTPDHEGVFKAVYGWVLDLFCDVRDGGNGM
jgi:hypothetical protein